MSQKPQMPSWSWNLIKRLIKPEFREEILGDLEEVFKDDLEAGSLRAARRKYTLGCFKLLRPSLMRILPKSQKLNSFDMLQHNLLLTYRNFIRYKNAFLINLIGLSSGLACALFIYLWVNDELSIDRFHEKDKQLYQVMLHHEESGSLNTKPDTPARLAAAMLEEVPEVEQSVEDTSPTWFGENFTVSDGDVNIKSKGKFAGKAYFDMFSFGLIHGDGAKVLTEKNSMVLSESLAKTLFETPENAMGKTVEWNLLQFSNSAIVSGVFQDIPSNSTDQFEFVIPFEIFADLVGEESIHWGNYNAYTHVILKEGTDLDLLNQKIEGFIKDKVETSNVNLFVRPFSDKYLHGRYENGQQAGGRIEYVRLLSIVAIFILFIACINFMNLSTAKASRRIKEVGVKKAIGASRKALILQYLSESVLLVAISLAVAILVVTILLPQFNFITGKDLTLQFDLQLILAIAAIGLVTGVISGSYPAIYLSGFSPVAVLKGKLNASVGELWARKGLVVFQFALSIFLIVSVMVVYFQIEYVQSKNLGYDRENVIVFPKEGAANNNIDTFLAELKKIPGVVNCAATAHAINDVGGFTTGVGWEGHDWDVEIRFAVASVYYDLIETVGIQLKNGRSYSREFSNEEDHVLFNETAIKTMGLAGDPVGQVVSLWGDDKTIIGVVKDFNFESLHSKVIPILFRFNPESLTSIMVKIEAGSERETLAELKEFYSKNNPGYTLDYVFMDQQYQAQYVSEQRVAMLSRYFAGIAVLISCLGLFGLAAFSAERRIKEVGIRKILGSSTFSITMMLSKDFTKMVLAAILLALPISYVLTQNWLKGFAYRIELQWWFFIGAGAMALLIAWLTVGFQTIRAARVNPARCLRD